MGHTNGYNLDDLPSIHGIHGYGFPMDWQPNSCISVWYEQLPHEDTWQKTNSLIGGIPPYIYGDIGGADRWVWFV